MAKKIIYSILFIFIISLDMYGVSASGTLNKYGYFALGDNVSTLFYNPAGLFNISSRYDEFVLSTSRKFEYNSFAIGKYITRFGLFSDTYKSSVNIGLGLNNGNGYNEYILGVGGTMVDFWKYGINIKSIEGNDKYIDFDFGFMFKFKFFPSQRYRKSEFALSFTAKNISDKDTAPLYYIPSLYLRPITDVKITAGIFLDKDFKDRDYSAAADVNLIGNFYIYAGVSKHIIPFGFKWELTEILRKEVITVSVEYNSDTKKIERSILSYRHRFNAYKLSSSSGSRGRASVRRDYENEEDLESSVPLSVIRRQKKILEKAKFYFAQEKLKLAERKFREVIKINKNTDVAAEAADWLKKIKDIKRKLK